MLMLCLKTRILHQNKKTASQNQVHTVVDGNDGAGENPLMTGFLNDLHKGLQLVIRSLANYSIAFEAVRGIKGMFTSLSLYHLR